MARELATMPQFNDSSILAYWKCEDTSDSKGSFTLTNVNSTTFTPGKFNNAANFVIASSQSLYNASTSLNLTGPRWYSMVVTTNSFGGANIRRTPFSEAYANNSIAVDTVNILGNTDSFGTSNAIIFRSWATVGGYLVLDSGVVPTLGVPYKVDVVIASDSDRKLYINGVLKASSTSSRISSTTLKQGISLGVEKCGSGDGSWHDGQVDDCFIANRAPSADEIAYLYRNNPFGDNRRGRIARYFASDPSLKGCWSLNGSSIDNSGNGLDGIDNAVSYVPGKFGKSAKLNGSSSVIDIGDTPFDWIEYNQPFSLLIWAKHNYASDPGGGKEPDFFGKGEINSPYPGFQFGMTNRTGSELNLDCQFISAYNVGGQNFTVRSINMLPYKGIATLVALTYDGSGSASGMQFYVNGLPTAMTVVSGSTTCTTSIQNNKKLGIGAGNGNSEFNWFDGTLEDAGIFKRKISLEEMRAYYKWATAQTRSRIFSWLPILTALFTETITHTDSFLRTVQRALSDSTTYTATFSNQNVKAAILTEVVTYTDSMYRVIARIFSEVVTYTDIVIKTAQKVLTEVVTHTATFANVLLKTALFTETVTYTSTLFAFLNGFLTGIWHRTARVSKVWKKSARHMDTHE